MTAAKDRPRKPLHKPVEKGIIATIRVLGKTYEAKGKSVTEALAALQPGRNPRGRGILTVSDGKTTISKVLPPVAVVRLFSPSRLMRELQLKNLYFLFEL